ncbi:condensation domain-containing protein, partial [Paenibacillus sp. 22594]|uniref:condensation domain-containing protein n=1 Tax=Paenibacillus sp. 22594 TaxID=3453947 RepID=UPI003F84E760
EYKDSPLLQKERAYWEQVATQMAAGELGMDEQTGESGYGSYTIQLNEKETEQLIHQSGRAYSTEINDLLISALGMTVKKLTGARGVTIGMEGHGREPIHKRIDIDRTVGWFTSMYPVVVPCHEDLAESIITTKEVLRRIPNRGFGYGLLQEELPVRPLDIMFNYMGQMDAEAKGKKLHFFGSGKGSADENIVNHKVTINGSLLKEHLHFSIVYDKSKLPAGKMQLFIETFHDCLISTIQFCASQEEVAITISDTDATDLDADDLQVINELFDLE